MIAMMVLVLDTLRILTAVAGVALSLILMWRARRWIGRFYEPAYLHLCALLLAVAASMNALDHMGEGVNRFTVFNIGGIAFGWIFVFRTPMEKTYSWKENRGDPPDWDDISRGANS